MDPCPSDEGSDWPDEALAHFERETGVPLSLFVDFSKLDKAVLACALSESLNTVGGIVEVLEKAGAGQAATEIVADYCEAITAPPLGDFFTAAHNHFLRSIKQDTKHMPLPLKDFLNRHGSTMTPLQATGMHRYLRGHRDGVKDFLDFLSESPEGEKVRAKLTLRNVVEDPTPDPRTVARKHWMTLQLWRMTPQARRASMGLSKRNEWDLRETECLPVLDDPPIVEYNPGRKRFIDRNRKETMRSLPLLIEAVLSSRK